MESQAAVKRAYARLGRLTPIKADCGKLCGKRCCKGGDDQGMILFPGEEKPPGPFTVYDRDINGYPVRFTVCKGWCKRDARPLSCRIFPFAPYLSADGAITIIPDPRARYVCPLLAEDAQPYIDQRFLNAVGDAFNELSEAAGMRPMLEAYAKMLDEYKRFTG